MFMIQFFYERKGAVGMTAESVLRERGLRVTPQRRAVLEYFLQHPGQHQTADGLWSAIQETSPEIARGTVYKALHDLIKARVLEHLPTPTGGDLYGLRLNPHHHFVCLCCGGVDDLPETFQPQIEYPAIDSVTSIASVDVVFRGVCQRCSLGQSS